MPANKRFRHYCLVFFSNTEYLVGDKANVCISQQVAQSRYMTVQRSGIRPTLSNMS